MIERGQIWKSLAEPVAEARESAGLKLGGRFGSRQRAEDFPPAGDGQTDGLDLRPKELKSAGQIHPVIGNAPGQKIAKPRGQRRGAARGDGDNDRAAAEGCRGNEIAGLVRIFPIAPLHKNVALAGFRNDRFVGRGGISRGKDEVCPLKIGGLEAGGLSLHLSRKFAHEFGGDSPDVLRPGSQECGGLSAATAPPPTMRIFRCETSKRMG